MSVNEKIVSDLVANEVSFVTTVPCKQLAGVIDVIDANKDIYHIPANKDCLLYTSPSPRDATLSRMPSSA